LGYDRHRLGPGVHPTLLNDTVSNDLGGEAMTMIERGGVGHGAILTSYTLP
jgi:hypothetical protein